MIQDKRLSIIADLYQSDEVNNAIGKMQPESLREDLKQEMFEVLCKMDIDRLIDMSERKVIKFFLVRTMTNMIQSDRSGFFNTHRKEREVHLDGFLSINSSGEFESTGLCDMQQGVYDNPTFLNIGVLPADLITPDDIHLPDCILEKVDGAMATLDPYEAGMIRLYAEMGNTCKPVAEATNISERGVRFAVSKARVKLKKHIRNDC